MSGRSSHSAGHSSSSTNGLNSDDYLEEKLNMKLEELRKHTVEVERLKADNMAEIASYYAQTAAKVQKVQEKAGRLSGMVGNICLQNAKSREEGKMAVNKLYNFLDSDSEVREEVAKLETGCNQVLNTVTAVHREFYHFGRLFDTKDMLMRVSELKCQTDALEETLATNEQPQEDKNVFENAVKGIMALGNGREEEAADLVNRLYQYAAFD